MLLFQWVKLECQKAEFVAFSRKIDNRLNDSETVVVGTAIVKKSKCKYLGVTIDSHLRFQLHMKKVIKNMVAGIKPIETLQQ